MFENTFKPRPIPRRNDDCKIKIKNTADGKTISFSGNCTKEQLSMAKDGFFNDDVEVEEE
jgi:hypothetical protein